MIKLLLLIVLNIPIVENMKNVVIYQDTAISQLIEDKINGTERQQTEISGYRVQIFSSNNQQTAKNQAFNLEKRINDEAPNLETYVQYNPPFWKVRIGNYRTQAEAQTMRQELLKIFPDLQGDIYVVRDQIIVNQ